MGTKLQTIRSPGVRARRGLLTISAEMGVFADVKAGEGRDGRREADDIRAALAWLDTIINPGRYPHPLSGPEWGSIPLGEPGARG